MAAVNYSHTKSMYIRRNTRIVCRTVVDCWIKSRHISYYAKLEMPTTTICMCVCVRRGRSEGARLSV